MTAWSNNLNGIASGTTVTTGNSGGTSGTAFSAATVPSSGSLAAQSAAAKEGATGLQAVVATTGLQNWGVSWTTSSTVGTRVAMSFWYKFAATPAAESSFATLGNNAQVRLTTARTIRAVGPGAAILGTSTVAAADTWVFIQAAWTPQSTNTSRFECIITDAAGTNYLTLNSTAASSVGVDKVGFGSMGSLQNGVLNTHSYDLLAADDTLAVGQFPGSTAPSAYDKGQFFPFF